MKINRVIIKNVMQFDNFDCDFNDDLNIIVGQNGVGKTNLMKLIYLAACDNHHVFLKNNFIDRGSEITIAFSCDEEDIEGFIKMENLNYGLWKNYMLIQEEIYQLVVE